MKTSQAAPGHNVGIASAIGVLFIWSGFFVFSRAGVLNGLTAADLTGLRFIVAGTVTLPFLLRWWPRHMPLRAQIIISLCGPGAFYSMLIFLGLQEASAAYAGVFTNGAVPIFTVLLVAIFAGERPDVRQALGLVVIVVGAILLGWSGMRDGGLNVLLGVALFLTASALISIYIFSLKYWRVTPRQALALVNVPNAILFIPVWILVLPSGIADTPLPTIAFHALFQGLGPGFIAVILFALAASSIGPTATAGFSAAVPASASLLAIPMLGEIPSALEWTGIACVTLGLALMVIRRA